MAPLYPMRYRTFLILFLSFSPFLSSIEEDNFSSIFPEETQELFSLEDFSDLKKEFPSDLEADLALEEEIETFFDEEFEEESTSTLSQEPTLKQKTEKQLVPTPFAEKEPAPLYSNAEIEKKNDSSQVAIDPSSSSPLSLELSSLSTELPVEIPSNLPFSIDFSHVFAQAPLIYALLLFLSISSFAIWLYTILSVNKSSFLPKKLIQEIRAKLLSYQFDEALELCAKENHFFSKMLASGLLCRKHGLPIMLETMKSEGKRSASSLWQKIHFLNDIAVIAPMLGLLGTVLGMFYAFYDVNRSVESLSSLFDGLGVSVGTTVAGLIVAIIAMTLHSMAKYRLIRILVEVENEAQNFAALIDTRSPDQINV